MREQLPILASINNHCWLIIMSEPPNLSALTVLSQVLTLIYQKHHFKLRINS